MEKLTIKIDAEKAKTTVREIVSEQLATLVVGSGVAWPVILRLLREDATSRTMLAEAMGEKTLKVVASEEQAQIDHDADRSFMPPDEKSWDEIMTAVINEQLDTPGGRCEV